LTIDPFDLLDKIKRDLDFSTKSLLSIVPSTFMRCLILKNVSDLASIADIYYALKLNSKDCINLLRIVYLDDSQLPGLNQNLCVLEFSNHISAKNTLTFINKSNNKLFSNISNTQLEAVWCEPHVNLVTEAYKLNSFYFIENINCNNIYKIKEFFDKEVSNTFDNVKKIRKYNNGKILIEFSRPVKLPNELVFEGRNCFAIPAIRANKNMEKYREKLIKILPHYFREDDKKLFLLQFSDNVDSILLNESYGKKADLAYSKVKEYEKKGKRNLKLGERIDRKTDKTNGSSKNIKLNKNYDDHNEKNLKFDNYDNNRSKLRKFDGRKSASVDKNRSRSREMSIDRDIEYEKDNNRGKVNQFSKDFNGDQRRNYNNPSNNSSNKQIPNPSQGSIGNLGNPNIPNSSVLNNLQSLQTVAHLGSVLSNPNVMSLLQTFVNSIQSNNNSNSGHGIPPNLLNLSNMSLPPSSNNNINSNNSIPSKNSASTPGSFPPNSFSQMNNSNYFILYFKI